MTTTPANFMSGSCLLWMDAEDSTTITNNGNGKVTSWFDKSGITYPNTPSVANSSSANITTLYIPPSTPGSIPATGSVIFSGNADDKLLFPVNNLGNTGLGFNVIEKSFTFFFMNSEEINRSLNFVISSVDIRSSPPNGTSLYLGSFTDGGFFTMDFFNRSVSRPFTRGSVAMKVAMYDITTPPGSGTQYMYINGNTGATNPSGTLLTRASDSFGIGGAGNGINPFKGAVREIIFYNKVLTDTERKTVEGYLAWKWGTQGSLPAGHTYKSAPPPGWAYFYVPPPCFLPFTRILTPLGYRAVETLEDYDQIETGDGRSVPVKIFKTYIAKTNQDTAPYCIPRGSIAPNIPDEDLHVSGLHAIQDAKGMWQFPMGLAMHKDSRVQQHLPGRPATYYHLECPNYFTDNLVANNTIAESFRNKQGREGITFEYCEAQQGFIRNKEDEIKDDISSDVLAVYC